MPPAGLHPRRGAPRAAALLALVLAGLLLLLAAVGCKDDESPVAGTTDAAPAETAPAGDTSGPSPEDLSEAPPAGSVSAIPDLVARVEPSVVAVQVRTPLGSGEGSGVIWDADGLIVTNDHVVDGAAEVIVAFATGERVPADVVDTDPLTDLAVLRVDRDGLPAASFAENLPRVGELALAIGNPLGFESTVSAGIVSGLHRSIPAGGIAAQSLVDLIQTDAAISPGNSGGALVDAAGQVIGINVAYIPPQARAVSIGFAIPAPTVVAVVEQLLEDGEVRHAFLGIRYATLTREVAEEFGLDADRGVLVTGVEEGTPADEAGLRPGDIIIRSGSTPIDAAGDLLGLLRRLSPGDTVELTVLRDGRETTVRPALTERPPEQGG